jgi:uncharacterized membrane protein (UPF0127 family)
MHIIKLKTLLSINLLFLFLLVTISCSHKKRHAPNPNIPPKYVITHEPVFKYQGNLWFINETNDTLTDIEIEIADTDPKRETGLMYRKEMAQNRGMLFIFPDEQRRSFWMKNTEIPLDIIFVNADSMIIHVSKNNRPYSLKSIPSFEYAQYVVEVNAGFCKKYSIKTGGYIKIKHKSN